LRQTGYELRIALHSGARTGDYNVKEIKGPIFLYKVYLLESRWDGQSKTILGATERQRLG
jgi:hypothetical protein